VSHRGGVDILADGAGKKKSFSRYEKERKPERGQLGGGGSKQQIEEEGGTIRTKVKEEMNAARGLREGEKSAERK